MPEIKMNDVVKETALLRKLAFFIECQLIWKK